MITAVGWGQIAHLSTIRLAVLFIWIVTVAKTPYESYAHLPPGEGFGVGRLLLAWPVGQELLFDPTILISLQTVALLTLSFAAVIHRWWITPMAFCIVILLDVVSKSVGGFANHAATVPLLALGLFSLFAKLPFLGAQELATLPRRRFVECRRFESAPPAAIHMGLLSLLQLAVVLPYSFVGLERILQGGLSLFSGTALLQYLSAASRGFASYEPWLGGYTSLLQLEPVRAALNLGFLMVTMLEITSAGLLWSQRYRRLWLAGMVLFQLSTCLLMNIVFWENMLLAAVVWWNGWTVAPRQISNTT